MEHGSGCSGGWADYERRFLSVQTNLIIVRYMQMKVIYKDEVLKLLNKSSRDMGYSQNLL